MSYNEFVKSNGTEQYSLKIGKRIANTLAGFIAGFLMALIAAVAAYYAYVTYWGK